MASSTSIEWTETTWNPVTGCDRISLGCDNCYALRLAKRLKAMGVAKYQTDGDPKSSGPGFGVKCHPKTLIKPYSWQKERLVFVNSMSDLFHNDVPAEFIREVFDVMAETPQHTYQILTKRAQRLSKIADSLNWSANIWMGVSVETQRYAFRVKHLLDTPAAVKFVSAEPLLGEVKLPLDGIDWVIVGGESGHGHRDVIVDWIRRIRDDCQKTDTAFFFKQWGGRYPKANGRELDGKFYDEMPAKITSGLSAVAE